MSATDWIQTYTGRKFSFLDPQPEDVDIVDIAHSLSQMCRYTGHCFFPYSVAQHSRLVSGICAPVRLWGLMHDASEAYLTDIPRPIKPYLPEYKVMEDKIQKMICDKFGLSWPMPLKVVWADVQLLINEKEQIMAKEPDSWNLPEREVPVIISRETPEESESRFLATFHKLTS